MASSKNNGIPVSCNFDCGGNCPLLAHLENGKIVRISDNPLGGPYLSGCVKGLQFIRNLYSPERLRKPLQRTGPKGSGRFKEIEWPQALDLVAERLADIKDRHGNEAVIRLRRIHGHLRLLQQRRWAIRDAVCARHASGGDRPRDAAAFEPDRSLGGKRRGHQARMRPRASHT